MAQVWQCDRCKAISDNGTVDDPPDGWERYKMPVRGSEGARSMTVYALCAGCEDSLYAWLYRRDDGLATAVKQAANLLYNLSQRAGTIDTNDCRSMREMSDALDPVTRALGGHPHTAAW